MQGNSLRDSHRKNKWTQSRTQHSEYRERLHFWSPTPPQGPSLWGRNLSIVQAHYLGPHKLLPSPSLAPESLSDASTTLDHSTGQALFRPPRFWPAQPPSHSRGQHYLWSHSGVAEEELEEGGIWWKSTCQPEILLGENTVHALRQSSGVGAGRGTVVRRMSSRPAGAGKSDTQFCLLSSAEPILFSSSSGGAMAAALNRIKC